MRAARPLLLLCLSALIVAGVSFWYTSSSKKSAENIEEKPAEESPSEEDTRDPFSSPPQKRAPSAVAEEKPGPAPMARGEVKGEPPLATGGPEKNFEVYNGVPLSDEITLNDRGYRVLRARAIPKARYEPSMGAALFEQAGFMIVPGSAGDNADWTGLPVAATGKAVVVHATSGMAAVVTGTIVAKYKDAATVENEAARMGLKVLSADQAINIVYLAVQPGASMIPALEALSSNPEFERAEIEMVNNLMVSQ